MKVMLYAIKNLTEEQNRILNTAIHYYKTLFDEYIDNPSDDVYKKIESMAMEEETMSANPDISITLSACALVRALIDDIHPRYRASALYHDIILNTDLFGIPVSDEEFSKVLEALESKDDETRQFTDIPLPYLGMVRVNCHGYALSRYHYPHYKVEISQDTDRGNFPSVYGLHIVTEEVDDNG